MQISITGHHMSVTPALSEAVHEKLEKITKHFEKITSMKVLLSLDNHHSESSHKGHKNHKAEAIVRVPGGELHAHATADDMYTSIAMLSEKLDKQICKLKDKKQHKAHDRHHQYIDLELSA